MTNPPAPRGLLHRATHRLPGVPAHTARPAGHQGTALQRRPRRSATAPRPAPDHHRNHSPARPPRLLPGWQRRIAALFGQEL